MNKRQTIPFILLLCAFLLWLYFKPAVVLPELEKQQPNYIAYNVSSTHFDEMGAIGHELFADKTTHFTEKGITLFENPKVIIYIEDRQTKRSTTWQISSKEGILYEQNRLILANEVQVKNLSLDQLVQTMSTEKLTILLDKKEISSDQLVTWQGPQMQQQGVGMWASLITEELIVKNQINAVYHNEEN
ncbi:LPS export ABC transporter periplasmic protein LptC [Psychromonas antarctica]|jgi:lipopolysaccharide export system protein LptC|uniref:LPS export ABC transporter periplasmic protein LptC n=1 Tax=Psychromonas antarctica TaxID=67573 RepID=UPI001EE8F9D3|nr:LPS export ABC transporter periplasmic protein LptC [Psychromonas antarctica]MCG6199728.1 LPS export ABC transporter periplasmic protein LptC [Psychromonas antarctica]